MPLLLVILFIVVPIVELAVLIQVGQLIGVWWTIALLIADALLGSWLLRSQGRLAWRRFNAALEEGRIPHREVVDGVLVIFGGVLLLTPGFISDIFGLLFLFPLAASDNQQLTSKTPTPKPPAAAAPAPRAGLNRAAAARNGVALEVNAQPSRIDLDGPWARRARAAGARVAINTDSHATSQLELIPLGVGTARRGWIEAKDVLNAMGLDELLAALKRKVAGG